jgi:hypothetical protein
VVDKGQSEAAFQGEGTKGRKYMTRRNNVFIQSAALGLAGLTLSISIGVSPVVAAEAGHDHASPARLVQLVRDATRQYVDVNAATAAGYQPFLGCVSGQDHGAMGQHYVNGVYAGDGEIDVSRPEALIYESSPAGLQLLGVEFLVFADAWLKNHTGPPVLEGQTFLFVDSPNRYNLPAHFELHVWAWRDNPNGAFVDWNNKVSCENQ